MSPPPLPLAGLLPRGGLPRGPPGPAAGVFVLPPREKVSLAERSYPILVGAGLLGACEPLRALAALRCPWARIRQGDIWRADWSAYELVYLFQRPESMPRAVEKARRELAPGAWLASLEFEAAQLVPDAVHACPDGRTVWLYRQPFTRRRDSLTR